MNGAQKPKRRNRARVIENDPGKKVRKRRRCQNCNKLYSPVRDDQKFCRDNDDPDKCRKEFYRYGSSYGPLRSGLHNAIDKKCAELREQFRDLKRVVDALTKEVEYCYGVHKSSAVEVSKVRAEIDALRGQNKKDNYDVV